LVTEVDGELKSRAEGRVGLLLRDKWRIDGLLGLGGMAAVYSATHRNGKRAAVKILHAEAALSPDIRARFLREGYLANKVEHPGAVSILDDDVDSDGTVFLVMELLHGQTLESAREGGSVSIEELLVIAHRVLDVLAAAHERKIVHRDLKPANVFVCTDGTVKILDFGIARLNSVTQTPSQATGRDSALGTPGYMPPEQARGRWEEVDGQSDLWSLGATLFAVLGGRPVHQAPTVNEQLLAAMTLPAPPLSSVAPNAPHELALLVDRALSFEKSARFADARAMQAEVARVFEEVSGKPLSETAPLGLSFRRRSVEPEPPTLAAANHTLSNAITATPRRVSPLWAVAVGLSAAVLFGVLGFVARSSRGSRSPAPTAVASPAPVDAVVAPTSTPSSAPQSSFTAPATVPLPSASAAPAPSASTATTHKTEPKAGLGPKAAAKAAGRSGAAPKPSSSAAPDPFIRRK